MTQQRVHESLFGHNSSAYICVFMVSDEDGEVDGLKPEKMISHIQYVSLTPTDLSRTIHKFLYKMQISYSNTDCYFFFFLFFWGGGVVTGRKDWSTFKLLQQMATYRIDSGVRVDLQSVDVFPGVLEQPIVGI